MLMKLLNAIILGQMLLSAAAASQRGSDSCADVDYDDGGYEQQRFLTGPGTLNQAITRGQNILEQLRPLRPNDNVYPIIVSLGNNGNLAPLPPISPLPTTPSSPTSAVSPTNGASPTTPSSPTSPSSPANPTNPANPSNPTNPDGGGAAAAPGGRRSSKRRRIIRVSNKRRRVNRQPNNRRRVNGQPSKRQRRRRRRPATQKRPYVIVRPQ
ncbi:sporozoite surface protein 2 [Eurosta solidaginis]|uniref:sporozoite surface protein 2 n=1 Tax=Eurosta solidaginis TaxID=178769 RepID=UPI0035307118